MYDVWSFVVVWLGADRAGGGCVVVGVGDEGESAAVECVEAEVAAAVGPFVVLFGQDGSDEADDGGSVGEDADHVGAAADFAVEPFVGVDAPMDVKWCWS